MVSYNHKSKQWLVGVGMKFFLALDKEKASSVTVVCDKVTPMVEKTQQKKIRGTPPFFFLKEKIVWKSNIVTFYSNISLAERPFL